MFTREVMDKITRLQYVRINKNNIPSTHNPGFYEPFLDKDLLLLAEPKHSQQAQCICVYPDDGGATVYPNVYDTVDKMIPQDYRFYTSFPLNRTGLHTVKHRNDGGIFGKGGLVAIKHFILDKVDMKELGKSKLERL